MPPDPARITVAAVEPGFAYVRADGVIVGHATADHQQRWTARLWRLPDSLSGGFCGEVEAAGFPALRETLTARYADDGPWWTTAVANEGHEDASLPGSAP